MGSQLIGAHSHIHGLGVSDDLNAQGPKEGMIGLARQRRAAGAIVRLIQCHHFAGRALLLVGPPGTGKTALAQAMASELARHSGVELPFVQHAGSEFFSLEMSKSEALTQALRRSIGFRVTEETEVIEGEVAQLTIQAPTAEAANADRKGRIVLKTTDMESEYELGPKLVELLSRESVAVGDVISLDKANGRVTKLGRSYARASEYEVSGAGVRFVQTPEGELQHRREVTHVVTLHEMDAINSRAQGFVALFSGETGEIKPEVRAQVDEKVARWCEEGRGVLLPGVLFIDEAHMMDVECFAFLNRALESKLAPFLVLASNRGYSIVRGTNQLAPYGLPPDLLDRCLTIPMEKLTPQEQRQVLQSRADEEDIEIETGALNALTDIAAESSMRYAIQLLTISRAAAGQRGSTVVSPADIARVQKLFYDRKRSAKFVDSYRKLLLSVDLEVDVEDAAE